MTWAVDRVKLVCRKNGYGKSLSVYRFFFGTEIFKFISHTSRDKSFSKKKMALFLMSFKK